MGQRLTYLYHKADEKNIGVNNFYIRDNAKQDYLKEKLKLGQETVPLALVSMGYKS